ncbi:MAG: galactose-1-phosphate uridylyltransferase [Armatimonadetes bacterium]|nr:galactose-1-phosphate uridylyltransferase [Armatimonadota bacterium]
MPEMRRDPLTRRWTIIATERSKRPHDLKKADDVGIAIPDFVPNCPFCPGNEAMTPPEVMAYRREDSASNGTGWWVRVVPNKFPALAPEGELTPEAAGVCDRMNAVGAHEVIIETPRHDENPANMPANQFRESIWAYRDRCLQLMTNPRHKSLIVFRNHGKPAGASLEHPHTQLAALPIIVPETASLVDAFAEHQRLRGRCALCDLIEQEQRDNERIILENERYLAYAPFASQSPYETCIAPKACHADFMMESQESLDEFAQILQELCRRYDHAFGDPPYNYMIMTAPVNRSREIAFHWRLVMMPRLTVAAGFEMGTGVWINVASPESAAQALREAVRPLQTEKV